MTPTRPLRRARAREVVAWCADSPYSREWVRAGATDPDGVLAGWHTDPDITG